MTADSYSTGVASVQCYGLSVSKLLIPASQLLIKRKQTQSHDERMKRKHLTPTSSPSNSSDSLPVAPVFAFELHELLPDEIWGRVFRYAKFPVPLCLVCRRWLQLYELYFCYVEDRISWLETYRTQPSRGSAVLSQLVSLIVRQRRSPLTLFLQPSVAQAAFFAGCFYGNTFFVEYLLRSDPRVDPSAQNNLAVVLVSLNGSTETLRVLLQDARVDPSASNNLPLRTACEKGHIEIVKLLMQDPRTNPSADNHRAIRIACSSGHSDILKVLLADERVDPAADDDYALRYALGGGHTDCVRMLLTDSRIDPTPLGDLLLRRAALLGHKELIDLLLSDPRIDPSTNNNFVLLCASCAGHHEIVKRLLYDPRVDPSCNSHEALLSACRKGHIETVELLSLDPRVQLAQVITELLRIAQESRDKALEEVLLRCMAARGL